MIPPIDPEILAQNPKFAVLYQKLTTTTLNADGSTRDETLEAEIRTQAELLKKEQLRAIKHAILQRSLNDISDSPSLPPELREPSTLLAQLFACKAPLPPATLAILESTAVYASLPKHMPQIRALVSADLHDQTRLLTRMMNPTNDDPTYIESQIPHLVTVVEDLQTRIASQKAELNRQRAEKIRLMTTAMECHREAVTVAITYLEKRKHGSEAESVKVRSEYLALQAKELALRAKQLEGDVEDAIYTPQVRSALEGYSEHLRDGMNRLAQREKAARRALQQYGVGETDNEVEGKVGKERLMKEIARVYGQLQIEIDEVKADLKKLKGS